MSYIREIEVEEADGDLKALYEEVMGGMGGLLPSWIKAFGHNPAILRQFRLLIRTVMAESPALSGRRKEMLANYVSALNGSGYWLVIHGEILRAKTGDDGLVSELGQSGLPPELEDQERAMLAFAGKLTRQPAAVQAADVEALRNAGFEDGAILEIVMVAALFNLNNRTALGLGHDLEPSFVARREEAERRRRGPESGRTP